ncbi:MAG TPA: VTT domain-containing protein [Candidatus Olsenella pullicola]|nr:VTT domain-containing protein [Candidatus Olsenella pullicola]
MSEGSEEARTTAGGRRRRACAVAATAALAVLALALGVAYGPELWGFFTDGDAVRAWVDAQGPLAPVAMGALVVAQIVVAVLPGEPVELAAGYLFGFWEGTAVCLAGGLVGTLVVTVLVRALGMRVVRTFFSAEQLESVSWLRDSARFELLMLVVFLIPGTPKDVLTYAAGLTTCRWWRIAAIATVGRIPSVVTSTLAAGFASQGDWVAAGATFAATLTLVGAGAAAYAAMRRKEAARQGQPR